jgi:hypothetical protein
VYAREAEMDEDGDVNIIPGSPLFKLYHGLQALSAPRQAMAGYACLYGQTTKSRKVFIWGPCIVGCSGTGEIIPGTIPEGTIDEEYSHQITTANTGDVSADGLPPGLSILDDLISGTPEGPAKKYYVTLTASSTDTPPCPLTKIIEIVIVEAPPPPP